MEARRLLDDRIEVGELVCVPRVKRAASGDPPQLGADAGLYLGPFEDAPEDPGQRRGRRLVAGHQQGEELIVQLLVAHGIAVLVARVDEHREYVVSAGRARSTPVGDGGEDLPVDRTPATEEAPPRAQPSEIDLRRPDGDHGRARAIEKGEEAERGRSQAVTLRVVV